MTVGIASTRSWLSTGSHFECEDPPIPQSDAAQALRESAREAEMQYLLPESARKRDLGCRFDDLAETWRRETAHMSSVHDMALHPAYQQIIGMGPDAIPFLMKELRRRPDHWFWALNAITGVDPVPPSDCGNLAKMAYAWVSWGFRKGKL